MSNTVLSVVPTTVATTAQQTSTPVPCDLGIDENGELMLTPDGDLALVSGIQRVAQDVWMLAVTPVGANYADPRYGSQLPGLVGRRMPDQQRLDAYAAYLARQVKALQAKRAAAGDIPGTGEAIASVTATATRTGPNTITAPLIVRTQRGQTAQATIVLPS